MLKLFYLSHALHTHIPFSLVFFLMIPMDDITISLSSDASHFLQQTRMWMSWPLPKTWTRYFHQYRQASILEILSLKFL
jgi:hypothetical protein